MTILADFSEVIAITQEGKVIAYSRLAAIVDFGGGDQNWVSQIPDLRQVEYVLNIQFSTSPDASVYEAQDKRISGNLVGMTIYGPNVATGTTLTVEIIVIGPP